MDDTTQAPERPPASHDGASPLHVTDKARRRLLDLRSREDDADTLALRIQIAGSDGFEFTYDMWFEPIDAMGDTDSLFDEGDLLLVLPTGQLPDFEGATLDVPRNLLDDGLTMLNPNRPPSPFATGDLQLEGTVEDRITQLLDGVVNPMVAAHGGRADLESVDGDTAFVRMGGGCQGCGAAGATLEQGITAAILENVPEVARVVDVTDHTAGANPYY